MLILDNIILIFNIVLVRLFVLTSLETNIPVVPDFMCSEAGFNKFGSMVIYLESNSAVIVSRYSSLLSLIIILFF